MSVESVLTSIDAVSGFPEQPGSPSVHVVFSRAEQDALIDEVTASGKDTKETPKAKAENKETKNVSPGMKERATKSTKVRTSTNIYRPGGRSSTRRTHPPRY